MQWTAFTRIPLKAQVYERETYFREGLADARDIWGNSVDTMLRKIALLVIKPDGLKNGKASVVLDSLHAHDFAVVAVELTEMMRFHWRELWRYQLTSATLDRLAVNDLVLRDRTLTLLLRYDKDLTLPASVRLSGLKGPSDVALQSPDCLRRALQQPNRIFSFIHVADEPADVLRELAILLDRSARRALMQRFAGGELTRADQDRLHEAVANSEANKRAIDVNGSLERVEVAVLASKGDRNENAEVVLNDLRQMRLGERIAWRRFAEALAATGAEVDPWDLATLGSSFIVYDEPGHPKLITAVDAGLWMESQPS